MNLNISELEEKMIVGVQPKPQPKAYQQPALRKQLITTPAKVKKRK